MSGKFGDKWSWKEESAERLSGVKTIVSSLLEDLRSSVPSGSDQMYVETQLSRVDELVSGCIRRLRRG